jgi:hypothetical protein
MKTNPSARWIVRIRVSLLCLAIAGIAAANFGLSQSLASKFGQTTMSQPGNLQAPSLGISDLMAAAGQ